MKNHSALFRLSSAEGRLLHQKVEIVPESLLQSYVEKLKNPAGCAEVMRDIGSKSDVLQTLRARLTGLRDQEKAAIDDNLKAMQLKMDRNSPVSKALDVLRGRVLQSPQQSAAETAPTGTTVVEAAKVAPAQAAIPGAAARGAEAATIKPDPTSTAPAAAEGFGKYIPSNFHVSEWTWDQWKGLAATLGVGTLAVMLYRWIRGKKQDAKEGSSFGASLLGKALGASIIGLPIVYLVSKAQGWFGGDGKGGGGSGGGGPASLLDTGLKVAQTARDTVETGVKLTGGAASELSTHALNAGNTVKTGGDLIMDTWRYAEKRILDGQNADKEFDDMAKSGWMLMEKGAKFFWCYGGRHFELPANYIGKIKGWLEGKNGISDVAWVAGEFGGLYIFDSTVRTFFTSGFGEAARGLKPLPLIEKLIGAPYYAVRDGILVPIKSMIWDQAAIGAKVRGFVWMRGFREIQADNMLKTFVKSEGKDITSLERAIAQWQTFDADLDTVERYWAKRFGTLQFSDQYIDSVKGNHRRLAEEIGKALSGIEELPVDASTGFRNLWNQKHHKGAELHKMLRQALNMEGHLAAEVADDAAAAARSATAGTDAAGRAATHTAADGADDAAARAGARATDATGDAGTAATRAGSASGGAHSTPRAGAHGGSPRPSPRKPGAGSGPSPIRRPAGTPVAASAPDTAATARAAVREPGTPSPLRPRSPASPSLAAGADDTARGAAAALAAGSEGRGVEAGRRLVGASLENAPEAWRSHKPLEVLARSYSGETTAVFEAALKRVSSLTTSADDAVKLLQEANVVRMLAHDSPLLERAFKTAVQGQGDIVPAVRRLAAFIGCLGDKIKPAMLSEGIIKRMVASDISASAMRRVFSPRTIATLEAKLAEGGEQAAIEMIDQVAKHATRMSRIILGAGAALEAGMFLYDIYEYGQAKDRAATAVASLLQTLNDTSTYQKLAENKYRHKVTGQEFSIQETVKSIDDMPTAELQRCIVDGGSAAFAAGTAVASIWVPAMATSVAMGPAGLVVMSVVLVSHGAIAIADAERKHAFVRDTPMAQLLEVGAEQLLGTTALEGVANASSWQLSGNEKEMTLERKKFYMLMLVKNLKEIEKTDPEFALEITGGKTMHQLVDESGELYRTDFDRVILPVMATRMFQQANDKTSHWSEFKQGKISEGSTDSTNIDIEDVNLAMTDGLNFLRQDYRLKRKLAAEQELKQFTDGPTACANLTELDAQAKASANRQELEERAAALKAQTIFGAPADTVPPDASAQLIDAAVKKLDAATPIRTVQLPGGTFGPSQKTEETPQSDVKQEAFVITLPAFAFPDRKGNRTMPLWKVAREAAKSDVEDPEARYDAFLQRARTILDLHAREVAQDKGLLYARSEQLSPHDREILGKYLQVLSEYPEFDEDGSLRKMLEPMQDKRIAGWKPMMLTASTLIDKPATYAKLERHLEQIESRYYKVHGVDRASRPETKATAGNTQYLSNGSVRQWVHDIDRTYQGSITKFSGGYAEVNDAQPIDTLHVVFGGRDIEIKPNVPAVGGSDVLERAETIEGLGTFTCTTKLQAKKPGAKPEPTFEWKFIGAYPGATCYYYTVDKNGIEKPGNNITVEAQPTKEFVWNAVGGRSFTYRQQTFKATLFLKEGKGAPIEVSTPPRQPAGSKEKREGSIGGYVAITQEGNGWKFSPDTVKAGDIDRIEITTPLWATKMVVRSIVPPKLTPSPAAALVKEKPEEQQNSS
jgi:hypothetical protein